MPLLLAIVAWGCGTISEFVILFATAVGGELVKLLDMDRMDVSVTGTNTTASFSSNGTRIGHCESWEDIGSGEDGVCGGWSIRIAVGYRSAESLRWKISQSLIGEPVREITYSPHNSPQESRQAIITCCYCSSDMN